MSVITPESGLRKFLAASARAEFHRCFTCGSCAAECPVNAKTGALSPLALVRLAAFGLLEEALAAPEIWRCLQCRKCAHVCPMRVKPVTLIRFLRWEAVRQSPERAERGAKALGLQREFHRVRWHAVRAVFSGAPAPDPARQWDRLAATPVSGMAPEAAAEVGGNGARAAVRKAAEVALGRKTHVAACFTCEECRNACPAACERAVFDPVTLFRLANLGLRDEVLGSPALWLCIQCESCTQACGQGVVGHLVIRGLRAAAEAGGFAPPGRLRAWQEADGAVFRALVERIDAVF